MSFEAMVTSPGRLRILAALAETSRQPFVELRRRTGLTDGNLSTHARRLQSAGLVVIEKSITDGKPHLGVWQQIIHLECDIRPRERKIIVTVVGA